MLEGDGKQGIFFRQGFLTPGNVIGHISCSAIGISGGDHHAGGIKGFAGNIGSLAGGCGDLDLFHRTAEGHQVGRVVFEIDRTIFIHDGTADGVLCLVAGGGKEGVGHGTILLRRCIIRSGHTGSVTEDAELAGGHVVKEVHIHITTFAFIGRSQQAAGLGIALGLDTVGNAPGIHVHNGDIMAGVSAKLGRAGNAHIGSAIVNNGRAGTHGNAAAAILECNGPEVRQSAVADLDAVECTALGGKAESISGGIIDDGASNVAIQMILTIHQSAGFCIQQEQAGSFGVAQIRTIVGTHKNEAIAHISACPVVAALCGLIPGTAFCLIGPAGVFIGDGHADEVGFTGFAVPEAGVEIAVLHRQRTVGLAAQRIGVDPEGFQGGCVEGLDTAVGQGHEDHAFCIGGGRNGEAGLVIHLSGGQYFAGHRINTKEIITRIGDQITAHQNGTAHCIGIKTGTQFIGPVEGSIFGGGGDGGVGDGVVRVRASEIRPAGAQAGVNGGIDRGFRQFPVDGHHAACIGFRHGVVHTSITNHQRIAVIAGHFQYAGLTHVAVLRSRIGVGIALAQGEGTVFIRPQPLAGHDFIDVQQSISGIDFKSCLHGRRFQDVQGIDAGTRGSLGILDSDGHHLGVHGAVQCNGSRSPIGHIYTVDKDLIAHRFFAVAGVILISGEGQIEGLCRHGYGHVVGSDIGHITGRSIFLHQSGGDAVTPGDNILQRQFPAELHQIVLIAGNAVFLLRQADGQGIFDGVFIHQKTIQLLACLLSGNHIDGIVHSVIHRISKDLGIFRLNIATAVYPQIHIMFRVDVGGLIGVILRGKCRIQGKITLILVAAGRTKSQIRKPVAHIRKVHSNGAVGHILKPELVGNVVIGILRCDIAVGLPGDKGILVTVLPFCLPVGGEGHHNTVAVDHFNGHILVRNEGQLLALTGLNGQMIVIVIASGRDGDVDLRNAIDGNRNAVRQDLAVNCNGIALFQSLRFDENGGGGIQYLVGVFRHIAGKGRGCRLIRAVLICKPNGSQSGNAVKSHGIILGIAIAVVGLMGQAIDNGVARRTLGQGLIGTAGPGFKRQLLFHLLAGCHGVNGGQGGNLAEFCSIIFCVRVHGAHKQIGHQNRGMAVFPWGHGKFAVDEPVLFIAFLTVTAGEAERIGFQPMLFRKLHGKGSISGNHDRACHPEAIAFHLEGVISHRQIQPAVTVVGPHLAVGVFGGDGDAREIGGRINPVSVVEGDSMLFTNQDLLIFPDGGVQVMGQGSGIVRTASCKIRLCRIVFCLGGFADIILFFQIVCHRRHQLEQTGTGLTVRRRPLAEAEMGH